jgi:protein PhnA
MTVEKILRGRSGETCELCSGTSLLTLYDVRPNSGVSEDNQILICETCVPQVEGTTAPDSNHWRCLNESMWSEFPAVQVVAYRMLRKLDASWAQDLLSQLYLDEDNQRWADAGIAAEESDDSPVTTDSNGARLETGDTVTLIKDLDVKGANFTAKRGTTVKNISLTGDPKFVEGRVNGTVIVLVAAYLKKA